MSDITTEGHDLFVEMLGTEDMDATGKVYEISPSDMSENGLPYGAMCKCSTCGYVGRSTIAFDFYGSAGDPLVCESCIRVEWANPSAQK